MPSPAEARAECVARLCDGFSHDTRNPLNAVVIHVEVLADKLRRENAGAVPHGLERNLKAIRDQVHRLDEMVRRMVELAAPHRQTEPEVDLSALAHSVVEQVMHQARLARCDLRFETTGPARITAQASELGVPLALVLMAALETGARRLLMRTEASSGAAVLTLDAAIAGPALDGLRRAVQQLGGTLTVGGDHLELRAPLAHAEPGLHVVSESLPAGNTTAAR